MARFLLLSLPILASLSGVLAQTSTKCDPTKQSCPSKKALPAKVEIDFRNVKSLPSEFYREDSPGSISYDSNNGASFTLAKKWDSPTIISNAYLMFGYVEVVMRIAKGAGIVSSAVLQSDSLDEIDWEWLGHKNQALTNFFAKGDHGTYLNGGEHNVASPADQFHTYSVNWTSSSITWAIDGQIIREKQNPNAPTSDQYPQTPMQVRLGPWAAGESDRPGTVSWAGGKPDWSKGPYSMAIKSIKIINYSPGGEYSYGDRSGKWQSIKISGGSVNAAAPPEAPKPPPPPPPPPVAVVPPPRPTQTQARQGQSQTPGAQSSAASVGMAQVSGQSAAAPTPTGSAGASPAATTTAAKQSVNGASGVRPLSVAVAALLGVSLFAMSLL